MFEAGEVVYCSNLFGYYRIETVYDDPTKPGEKMYALEGDPDSLRMPSGNAGQSTASVFPHWVRTEQELRALTLTESRKESTSVLQPWLERIPIKMQSTLLVGLRGPDNALMPNIKKISKWLRGIAFKPGRMDNLHQFMGEAPRHIREKSDTSNELDFVPRHYYAHLMHSLEVVAYRHPRPEVSGVAFDLFETLCHLMHLPTEGREEFERRLQDVVWPEGQPADFDEAVAQLERQAEKNHTRFSLGE